MADLVREGVLHVDNNGALLTTPKSDQPVPEIFKYLTAKEGERDQGDAFIRWRVERSGDPVPETWEDQSLMGAWIGFDASQNQGQGFCMVTGKTMLLAQSHPKRLRHGGDGAKLISSNDLGGFTFLGRFTDADQALGVGFEVTQKAHNALRWLLDKNRKQAFRNGDQAVVAWSISESLPIRLPTRPDVWSGIQAGRCSARISGCGPSLCRETEQVHRWVSRQARFDG